MTRAACYARYSSDLQSDRSIEDQLFAGLALPKQLTQPLIAAVDAFLGRARLATVIAIPTGEAVVPGSLGISEEAVGDQ